MFEIKDINQTIAYYNKALVMFHLRQPKAALKIMLAVMKHIDQLGNSLKQQLDKYFFLLMFVLKLCNTDDSVAQKVGLLTVNLLLNTNQAKKADALIELLQIRLNIKSESLASDEDDDLLIGQSKEKPLKSLEQFKWMFRLYKIRSNVLNGKNILIPSEDTSEISILKAHQYYNGIDYQMAAKELSKPFANAPSTIK